MYVWYYTCVYARNRMAMPYQGSTCQKKPKNLEEVNEISTPPLILKSFSFWHLVYNIYI